MEEITDKKSMINILNDENALNQYILDLEDDINKTYELDKKVDTVIKNLEYLTDNFKDRRSLKGSLLASYNELVKFKSELPERRIRNKKTIMDIMTKKIELELKNKQIESTNQLSANIGNNMQSFFKLLDNASIQPIRLSDAELEAKCSNIIDVEPNEEQNNSINTDDESD